MARSASFLLAVDSGSLQAAAVSFLVSVSCVVEDSVKRILLLLVLGVPSVVYVACTCYDVHARWPYVLCLLTCFGGAAAFFFGVTRKLSLFLMSHHFAMFVCRSMGDSRRSARLL